MNALFLFGLLVVNFGISWWNAHQGGKYFTEVKLVKGWPRVLVWSALIMAAVGFTWVYLTLLAVGAVSFEFLTPEEGEVMFNLGYLILVPALLGSGTVIWVHSLINAWRKRQLGDVAVAAWNTYAHARNVWTAASHTDDALENVLDFFTGGSKSGSRRRSKSSGKGAGAMLIILLVVLAITGGIITTVLIAQRADREHALDVTEAFG